MLAFLFFNGCASQSSNISDFGPRWADYNEWRDLHLGMTPKEVADTLGEPFMTSEGYYQNAKEIEIIVFKLRPKYFVVREQKVVRDLMTREFIGESGAVTKPPKTIQDAMVWGDYYNLYCFFENSKLIRWRTTEAIQTPSDSTQGKSGR